MNARIKITKTNRGKVGIKENIVTTHSRRKKPKNIRLKGKRTFLKKIDLSSKVLDSISLYVFEEEDLIELIIENAQLNEVVEDIGNLKYLEVLDLSNNNLTKLPESIEQLSHLRILDLNNNQLSEIPEWITNLSQLERLYLNGNLIDEAEIEALKLKMKSCNVFF